ncbi:hypothetical protein HYU12_05380, partial [Candidatus Woesearchaeota archaeon]|nr:hypothetical protein [Candidatus Woesearchaeota archaeon]
MKKSVVFCFAVVALAVAVFSFSMLSNPSESQPVFSCSLGSFTLNGNVVLGNFSNATSTNPDYNVNVTLNTISFGAGDPSLTYKNSTNISGAGNFSLSVFYAAADASVCSSLFSLSVVVLNSTTNFTLEMGPNFPPLAKQDLVNLLDNVTIYTNNATELNLSAVNSTHTSGVNFSYVIFDDTLGFPIIEGFADTVTNKSVKVPFGRNYTVLFMRRPSAGDADSLSNAVPPIPVRVNLTQNPFAYKLEPYPVVGNLTFGRYNISGTINVTGNRTAVNVTNVLVKLGIAGLLPPGSEISAMTGAANITNASGQGSVASGFYIADYNVTVLGASAGIYQMLEWYASNTSAMSFGDGDYFAHFQNFTVSSNMVHNVVLGGMAGNASVSSEGITSLNTKYVSIKIIDGNGAALNDAHMELNVKMPGHKTSLESSFRYMFFSLSSGVFKLPLLNTSNATLKVFNKRFAPTSIELNVTNASLYPNGVINVTLSTFQPRRFNPNGSIDVFNSSQESSKFRVVFLKNSADCNVYNVSIESCRLGRDFDVGHFDPLKAMFGGKVNIYSAINTTGVITYFVGVDLLASGPPEGSMSEQPLQEQIGGGSSVKKQVWRFGSVAPPIYDKVIVGFPYNQSKFNEAAGFNISLDYLLNDNGAVIWNSSSYPNGESIPDAYSDYVTNWTNSSRGGMRCVNESYIDYSAQQCYINTTTNYVWMSIPHFTDV